MFTLSAWQGEVQLSDRAVHPSINTSELEEAELYVMNALNSAPDVRVRITDGDNFVGIVRTFEGWMELKADLVKNLAKRLFLDFDPETFASLERLRDRLGVKEHGEVVIKGLRLLHLVLKYQEEGGKVYIKQGNGEMFEMAVRT